MQDKEYGGIFMAKWMRMKKGLAVLLAIAMAGQPMMAYGEEFTSEAEIQDFGEENQSEENQSGGELQDGQTEETQQPTDVRTAETEDNENEQPESDSQNSSSFSEDENNQTDQPANDQSEETEQQEPDDGSQSIDQNEISEEEKIWSDTEEVVSGALEAQDITLDSGDDDKTEKGNQDENQEIELFSDETADASVVASGTCGENLTWTIDSTDTLNICGTGDMYDYNAVNEPPWKYCDFKYINCEGGVTGIGQDAFSMRIDIESAKMPGVKKIGDYAFYKTSLKGVEMPQVEEIGSNVFVNCYKLKSIEMSVAEYIGINAFQDCFALESVKMPQVKTICANAFSRCKNLLNADLSQVTFMGQSAFNGCTALGNVKLSEGLKNIEANAFAGCTSLTKITIPSTVTEIKANAFKDSPLSAIFFRGKCPKLGTNAFAAVNGGKYYYPAYNYWTGSNFKDAAFGTGKWISYTKWVLGNYVYNQDATCSSDGTETAECICGCGLKDTRTAAGTRNPDAHVYSGKTNKELPDGSKLCLCDECGRISGEPEESGKCGDDLEWSLYDSKALFITGTGAMYDYDVDNPAPWSGKPIIYCEFGSGVTSVGSSAFEECSFLMAVSFNEEITTINSYAFYGCSALKETELPKSVTAIGDNAFEGCTSLGKLTGYEKITSVKSTSFRKCGALTIYGYTGSALAKHAQEKGIPFESMGYWGICGTDMEWLLVGEELSVTGTGAMNDYTAENKAPWSELNVRHCEMKGQITHLGSYAFDGLEGLEDIDVGVPAASAGEYTFRNCTALKEISLPVQMTAVPDGMFSGCVSLESIKFIGAVDSLGRYAFRNCHNLKSFVLPENITEIKEGTFEGCGLTEIQFPSSVSKLGDCAFRGNPFKKITIPATVTELEGNPFSGCGELDEFAVEDRNGYFSAPGGLLYDKNGTKLVICPGGKSGSYTVPRRTKQIGTQAFKECKNITELILPSGVTSIESRAFDGMELKTIELPAELTEFSTTAFAGCDMLTSITVDADNPLYISVNGILCDITGKSVVSCPPGYQEVDLPEGLLYIKYGAFDGCREDIIIDLPVSMKDIYSAAYGEKTIFKVYDNAPILRAMLKRGYTCQSRGTYEFLWDGEDSEKEHITMAFDKLSDALKTKKDWYISYGPESNRGILKYRESTLGTGSAEYIYTKNYKKDITVKITFHISRDPEIRNQVWVSITEKNSRKEKGIHGKPEIDSVKEFTSDPKAYHYKWDLSRDDYINLNVSDEEAESIANSVLYDALQCLDIQILGSLPRENGCQLDMKDLRLTGYHNSNSIHTETTADGMTPGCTTEGKSGKVFCSICGALKAENQVLPATGHNKVVDPAVAPGCTVPGKTEGSHCSRCGQIFVEQQSVPATGHREVTDPGVAPTCTQEGKTEGSHCEICNEVLQEQKPIPATGHDFGEQQISKNPTCTETGEAYAVCKTCGEIKTEILAKTAHREEVIPAVAPTCEKPGLTEGKKCSVCGEILKKQGTGAPAAGHKMTVVKDKAATCGKAGTQHRECSICGYREKTTTVPATGKHQYGAYKITKAATVLETGTKTRICSVCGHKDNVQLRKLEATIRLNVTSIVLKTNQATAKVKVNGLAKGDSVVSWKSKDTKLVTVTKSGKITAKAKTGSTAVIITLRSGKKKEVKVKVQKQEVKTTGISGLPQKVSLKAGKKCTLKPVLSPITSVQKVTYTTSDKTVASVSSRGVITAKKAGKVKITVKAGTKKSVVTITVKK